MNQTLSYQEQAYPDFEMTGSVAAKGRHGHACAAPNCQNTVSDPWDETGTLCASCAIEGDLADRFARWDRLF